MSVYDVLSSSLCLDIRFFFVLHFIFSFCFLLCGNCHRRHHHRRHVSRRVCCRWFYVSIAFWCARIHIIQCLYIYIYVRDAVHIQRTTVVVIYLFYPCSFLFFILFRLIFKCCATMYARLAFSFAMYACALTNTKIFRCVLVSYECR